MGRILVFTVAAGLATLSADAVPSTAAPPVAATTLPTPFLKAEGTALTDREGRIVPLRGVNLGGWLEWQNWMAPMDASGTLRDANPGHNGYNFEVRRLLTRRFGAAVARELIDTFLDAWITSADFDNIQARGFNVVRLPFGYDTLLQDNGAARPDPFDRLDWAIREAWKRGIYTIVDYHAFLPPAAEQNGGADGYWADDRMKAETVRLWTGIARHYRGNPAVAMYDLLNEPNNSQLKGRPGPSAAAVCDLYDRLYKAIRAVDPDHAIAMEGVWDWKTLRDPTKAGYTNVVYSFHWYNWSGKTTAERNRATDRDLQSAHAMEQAWNVPVFIGEFNLFGDRDAWAYALDRYDRAGLSWTLWTCKNKASGANSWGVYTTIPGRAPPVPDLTKDDAETIRRKWKAWVTTPATFALNPMLGPLLVLTGPVQGNVKGMIEAGGTPFTIQTLPKGAAPAAKAEGDKVVVGSRTLSIKNGEPRIGGEE